MANYPYYGMHSGYMPSGYNQGYMPAQAPQNIPQQAAGNGGGFVCRPVTSRLEAETAQIPFDGSTAWFYDTSADRMYAKTFNFQDGTAPIVTYTRETPTAPVQYATVAELQALREELERLKKPARKAGKTDDPDE